MAMSYNLNTDNEKVRKCIRTLTSLLHELNVQKTPSKQSRHILPFLRYFTTLLTCGEKEDRQVKNVIAVTGSINPANQVRTLVVSQNPYAESTVQGISLQLVQKNQRPLNDVVKGPSDPPLVDHIADVWAGLSAVDRTADPSDYNLQVQSLEIFFLSRSYRKFVVRFQGDRSLCGGKRLYQVIGEWQPDPTRPEITRKWVAPPGWLRRFEGLPPITSRTVQGQVQWEFSDDTKKAWSKILETLLLKVDNAIEHVETVRGKTGKTETRQAISTLNSWCRLLYYFIVWDTHVVKSLLTETTMVASIMTNFMPASGSYDDAVDEFRQEPDESKSVQVFRYLKTIVAWHDAVHRLSGNATFCQLLENLEIGLVEVPPSPSSVLALPQIIETFFARFPEMSGVRESHVLNTLNLVHKNEFRGYAHAEAILMGLVNYYGHEMTYASQSAVLKNAEHMHKFIQPVADVGKVVIAASEKCCWCCDWLGQNLETQFELFGTHGIMYPWDPPVVGIGGPVMERLEDVLWNELHRAVSTTVDTAYSRNSYSGFSEGNGTDGMMTPPDFEPKV